MVALEAWALGKPVLANGRCDVLRGQCVRSNGGLYYENVRGVRRGAVRARGHRPARRDPRPQRPRVLPAALHVAGDRAEVPRDVRSTEARAVAPATLDAAARLLRAPAPGSAAGPARSSTPCRPARWCSRWRAASIRSSRRSAMATPSATRCSASARALRAAGFDSEIIVETADPRLEDLTRRLPRHGRRDHGRRPR